MKSKELKIKRQDRKNRGITLIALVVTIVVLLILAAVSIAMLGGENGIITQAIKAQEENEIAEEREKVQLAATAAKGKTNWGEITDSNFRTELDTNIGNGKYTLTKEDDTFTVTYIDSNRSYEVDANGNVTEILQKPNISNLDIGDYVNYTYDSNTYSLNSSKTGSTANNSTYTQNTTLSWQILNIHNDGTIDLISSTPTNMSLYFSGPTGYNRGVEILNDLCETLFSNKKLNVKARSISIKDIEDLMNDSGLEYKDNYIRDTISNLSVGDYIQNINPTNNTVTYVINKSYYPKLYEKEIGAGINTTSVNLIGLKQYESPETTITGYSKAENSGLTVTQTYYEMDDPMGYFKDSKAYSLIFLDSHYWLASRSVKCMNSDIIGTQASFNLSRVYYGGLDGFFMMYSNNVRVPNSGIYSYVRPVVSIGPNVEIKETEGTEANPHIITELED